MNTSPLPYPRCAIRSVLSGKLPVGYSKLTKLSEFTVEGNQVIGNIPKEYSTLINLSYVQASFDNFHTREVIAAPFLHESLSSHHASVSAGCLIVTYCGC